MMKKIKLIAFLFFVSTITWGQSVEITPLYGYTISGKVQGYYGTYNVSDDALFGGLLSVQIDRLSYFELSYTRTNTKLLTNSIIGGSNQFNIGVEHYQVGFLQEFQEGKLVPFAKVMLGTSRYVQTSKGNERYWLFSAGFGGGAKYFFNDRLGLRLYTNLMLPMEFAGGGLFCGIGGGGGGCSGGVSFNVPLVHWELGGGLIIRLQN